MWDKFLLSLLLWKPPAVKGNSDLGQVSEELPGSKETSEQNALQWVSLGQEMSEGRALRPHPHWKCWSISPSSSGPTQTPQQLSRAQR